MEDPSASISSEEVWAQEIAQSLQQQRDQVQEFLASQRVCLEGNQGQLTSQIDQISESLDRHHAETCRAEQEIECRSEQLQQQLETIEQLKQDLDARQARWEEVHRDATGQYEALAERLSQQQETNGSQLAAQIEAGQQREAELNEQLDSLRRQCEQLRNEIDEAAYADGADHNQIHALRTERDELSRRLEKAEKQLAQTLDGLQQNQQAQFEQFAAQTQSQIDELGRHLENQDEKLDERNALAGELEAGRERESELTQQLEALRGQFEQLRSEAAHTGGAEQGRIDALQAERDELSRRLADAEKLFADTIDGIRQNQQTQFEQFAAQTQSQIEGLDQLLAKQAEELADASAGREELATELEAGRSRESELNEQLQSLRDQYGQFREEADEAANAASAERGRLEALQAERDELKGSLADAEKQFADTIERLQRQQETQVAELAGQMQSQVEGLHQHLKEQTDKLAESSAGRDELAGELEARRKREDELNEQIETLRKQCDQLRKEADEAAHADGADRNQLDALRAERDELSQRLDHAEKELAGTIERLQQQQETQATELAAQMQSQVDGLHQHLKEQTDKLAEASAGRDELAAELEARRRRESELNEQIEAIRKQCDQFRREADEAANNDGADRSQIDALRAERDDLSRRLDQAEKQLAKTIERLQQQQETQATELTAQMQSQIEGLHQHLKEQIDELAKSPAGQDELGKELEARRLRETELNEQLDALREQCDQVRREAGEAASVGDADLEQLRALQIERDDLVRRLDDAEAELAQSATTTGDACDDDIIRRYEMAMEDVRDLQTKNQELQEQLDEAQTNSRPAATAGAGLDWEAQKKLLLASLDSDSDGQGDDDPARLEMGELVQKTDQVVADKDREIRELRQRLETQSTTHDAAVAESGPADEVLDNDAAVREEREKLAELQKELQEKLRQAELELSVERAKIARRNSEVEERHRLLEERATQAGEANVSDSSEDDGPPKRDRWLTRLGLKDS